VVLSGDATGRLMRYDQRSGNVTVLRSGLAFPNGVAISADRTHLVVAETSSCRLLRHWLRGPAAGQTEVLADLPGYPDNVRPDGAGRGGYWVGLNRDKDWAESGTTAESISAVKVVVPGGVGRNGTAAAALSGFGDVTVSEVVERNGSLWIGSVETPYVGLFKFASLKHG
jgi:hypothetical protein